MSRNLRARFLIANWLLMASCTPSPHPAQDGGSSEGGSPDSGWPDSGWPDSSPLDPCAVCDDYRCAPSCGAGKALCGDSYDNLCTDLQTDVLNCGACNHMCDVVTEACSGGACVPICNQQFWYDPGSCDPPQSGDGGPSCDDIEEGLCANGCCNLWWDPLNCGACGHVCAGQEGCSKGVCEACPAGDVCAGMACVSACPGGQMVCNGTCIQPFDTQNCGTCGHGCDAGLLCVDGACLGGQPCGQIAATCDISGIDAGPPCSSLEDFDGGSSSGVLCPSPGDGFLDAGGYTCVDLSVDWWNCGACGHACASDETCCGGTCGPECPVGTACYGDICLTSCPVGTTQCGALCTDLMTDSSNCSACGRSCGEFDSCLAGTCVRNCDSEDAG